MQKKDKWMTWRMSENESWTSKWSSPSPSSASIITTKQEELGLAVHLLGARYLWTAPLIFRKMQAMSPLYRQENGTSLVIKLGRTCMRVRCQSRHDTSPPTPRVGKPGWEMGFVSAGCNGVTRAVTVARCLPPKCLASSCRAECATVCLWEGRGEDSAHMGVSLLP